MDNGVWKILLNLINHSITPPTLQWRHNGCDSVSNHQPHHCLLNDIFRRRSKKTSKLRVTGLCAGNSPMTGEFPAQMASNAENVSIWWRHHAAWMVGLWKKLILRGGLRTFVVLTPQISHDNIYIGQQQFSNSVCDLLEAEQRPLRNHASHW